MKRWLPFILMLLAAPAFAHVPARLLGMTLKNSQLSTLNSNQSTYLAGGQRGTQTRTDGSAVSYNYDAIGQLKQALGSGGQSTENLGFGYDAAWNLNYRTNNGATSAFQVDNRNELTNAYGGANGFDSNGNLVSGTNGHTIYVYDDENRLVQWFSYLFSSNSLSGGDQRTDFSYDGLGRLRKRLEYTYNSGGNAPVRAGLIRPLLPTSWQLTTETHYIYDGMRVIQERDGNNTPLVSYTRGKDLSGSLEGAGGIGGLLGRSHGYSGGNWSQHNFYHADGAGNVTYLVNSSQTLAASYRYDPYGNTTASSGTMAAANVYRFSSKELHLNSGLYSYGYRFYSPNWQRWPNHDPIGEWGGINLYGFVGNDPINWIDFLGLDAVFTFVNGSQQTASNAGKFQSIANNAAKGSISDITVTGHTSPDKTGGADAQDLGRDENQGSIIKNKDGVVVLTDPKWDADKWPSLSDLLAKKLSPNGTITLKGCKSGVPSDPNNIAKAVSQDLPGVPVTGQDQNLLHVRWTDVTVPIPFYNTTTTYVNGKAK